MKFFALVLFCLSLARPLMADINASQTVLDGVDCHVVSWKDSRGGPRSLYLMKKNPGAMRLTYMVDRALVTNSAFRENHFIGELINHGSRGASASRKNSKNISTQIVLAGKHHYIFRYTFEYEMNSEPGKFWKISEDWEFIDGRDSFLQSVAYDSSEIPSEQVMKEDMRGPYNETDWTGGGKVSRVAWGNNFKFQTTGNFAPNPVTCTYSCNGNAPWTWNEPNTIPYVWEWCDPKLGAAVDREWGVVQNLPDSVMDFGGGYYGTGNMPATLPAVSGKKNLMFECWAAPTQMNCWDSAWDSGRVTWGTPYSVFNNGHSNDRGTQVMGNIFRPVAAWSWLHQVGKYSEQGLPRLVKDTENIFKSSLEATLGSVVTEGPLGPGDHVGPGVGKQLKKGVMPAAPYHLAGFDPVYRTWNVKAKSGNASFSLNVSGSLEKPTFVLMGAKKRGTYTVTLNGALQKEGTDVYFDFDAAGGKLWLTLNKTLPEGVNRFEIKS